MNKSLTLALSTALLSASATVSAGTASTTITPNLTITSGCSVDTSGIHGDVGSHPYASSYPVVPIGTLSVLCTNGLGYAFGVGGGSHGDVTGPRMQGTANFEFLPYRVLYAGAAIGDSGLTAVDSVYIETYTNYPAVTGLTGDATAQSYVLSVEPLAASLSGDTYFDTNTITVVWP